MYFLRDTRQPPGYQIQRIYRQGFCREVKRLSYDSDPLVEWLKAYAKADRGELVILFDPDGHAIEWERAKGQEPHPDAGYYV